MKNDKILTLYLPIAYALAWFLGFCLSTQGDMLKGMLFPCADSAPTEMAYTLFIATICVYVVFMIESFLNFIELGIYHSNRQFTGRVFYILAWYVLHLVTTFIVILCYIGIGHEAILLLLMLVVASLRFGITYLTNNIVKWSVDFKDNDYSSNI